MVLRFRNPQSGFVETVTYPFLWTPLFGTFYFMVKRVWVHALLSFILSIVTFGLSWLVYPFVAKGIITKDYLRNGWILLSDEQTGDWPAPSGAASSYAGSTHDNPTTGSNIDDAIQRAMAAKPRPTSSAQQTFGKRAAFQGLYIPGS